MTLLQKSLLETILQTLNSTKCTEFTCLSWSSVFSFPPSALMLFNYKNYISFSECQLNCFLWMLWIQLHTSDHSLQLDNLLMQPSVSLRHNLVPKSVNTRVITLWVHPNWQVIVVVSVVAVVVVVFVFDEEFLWYHTMTWIPSKHLSFWVCCYELDSQKVQMKPSSSVSSLLHLYVSEVRLKSPYVYSSQLNFRRCVGGY